MAALVMLSLFILLGSDIAAQSTPDDIHWSADFPIPGFDRPVRCLAEFQGKLVAAGRFTAVERIRANQIATWDSRRWEAIPDGPNGDIWSLLAFDSVLVVGGYFNEAGGLPAWDIAAWDGERWSMLDSGMNGEVSALAKFNGNLVAAGNFTMAGGDSASRVAMFHDSNWQALGAGLPFHVRSLVSWNGTLIAAGMTWSGDTDAVFNGIASWNGIEWSPLGAGMDKTILSLAVYDGELIAVGEFTMAGGLSTVGIARWDGITWKPLMNGLTGWGGTAAYEWWGKLFVGGSFVGSDTSIHPNGVSVWDGTGWSTAGRGVNGGIACFYGFKELLIGAGSFQSAGEASASSIAGWDGSAWLPLADGRNFEPTAATVWRNQFQVAEIQYMPDMNWPSHVYTVNGDLHSPIGGAFNRVISDLVGWRDLLVASGAFYKIDDSLVGGLATWDGNEWKRFGAVPIPSVYCLATLGDDLIVAGSFIKRWDGVQWTGLDSGFSGGVASAIVEFDHKLIAAGTFKKIGGVEVKGVAVWNGQRWDSMGAGITGLAYSLIVYDGKLYAGGIISDAGGIPVSNIASWDGTNWSLLGNGVNGVVNTMVVYDNTLIVGGYFSQAGEVTANSVAAWDGVSWSALGSGVIGSVTCAAARGDTLVLGGRFSFAGVKPSCNMAIWSKGAPTDVPIDEENHVLPGHFEVSQNYPNPFNPSTTIEYSLDHREHVSIEIYNALGEFVKGVVDETKPAGRHQVVWNGTDQRGRQVATGVYFYRVRIGDQEASKKMLLLK